MKKRTKNKKLLFVLAFLTALIMVITSCIDRPVSIDVDEESRSVIISFFTEQSVVESFRMDDKFKDIEAEDVEINGVKYVKLSKTARYNTFDEMESVIQKLNFLDSEDNNGEKRSTVFKEFGITKENGFFKTKYIFKAVINPPALFADGLDISDIDSVHVDMELPGNIIQCAGADAYGNILKCDIPDLSEETEMITVIEQTEMANVMTVIIVFVIIILIIGLIIFFFNSGQRSDKPKE